MGDILLKITLANIFVSLISLVGLLFISVKERYLNRITIYLVSFASGTLIGVAFLRMIPNSFKNNPKALYIVVLGILSFLVLEMFFYWRHCHDRECEVHSFAYLNLVGDALHNFIDGMVIAGSFVSDPQLGLLTVFAIVAHEIPQELGDFGVLLHGGLNKWKALGLNFATALFAVVGGWVGFVAIERIPIIKFNLVPFAAGGFIYIALVDLIPELHKRFTPSRSFVQFLLVLAGIFIFVLIKH